ncbi:hypothetical protein RFI_01592 [Reticulomyxa filosa]|uniref:Kelch motif family protein n=1 Tax=Reticulomyxa filosa TaxID=46433 RepID=X6PBI4_RETFI|nr:hypothetical protein RFI_01592 [Reticulomyxa filosa]|eukprot:ETO35473.1 hypothetical protein RFI_01592 [Reticulomyxa filosa]
MVISLLEKRVIIDIDTIQKNKRLHDFQIVIQQIGRDKDNCQGARAVIDGINNHLLFIAYRSSNISVFYLNTFQFIKHDTLPTDDWTFYHWQEIIKINEEKKKKRNYEMLLFCQKMGLSIEYGEDNNTFQFHQIPVCDNIAQSHSYAYVYVNDAILFFGGCNGSIICEIFSKSVHKYSIRENKWIIFQNTLPSPLCGCVAILSEDNTYVHIIGGWDWKIFLSTHMKTKVSEWLSEEEMTIQMQ